LGDGGAGRSEEENLMKRTLLAGTLALAAALPVFAAE
jgi:hypothetical protein